MASNITVDTLTKGSTTLNTDEIVDTNSSQVCKAWVNFNGSGTVAIRDSYNVSSITDGGTGDYYVNFINNMTNTNYVWAGVTGRTGQPLLSSTSYTQNLGNFRAATQSSAGSFVDTDAIMAVVFGD